MNAENEIFLVSGNVTCKFSSSIFSIYEFNLLLKIIFDLKYIVFFRFTPKYPISKLFTSIYFVPDVCISLISTLVCHYY